MNRFPEQQRNARIRRTRDVTALSRLALLLFCGLVLAGGFVFAAKQHFAAVQLGYKNENLRKERKKLIEDNQRLTLEKETVSAPSRLAPAAHRLGLQATTAAQVAKPQSTELQPEVTPEEPVAKESSKAVQASTR
jgi:cell division protein FtsL